MDEKRQYTGSLLRLCEDAVGSPGFAWRGPEGTVLLRVTPHPPAEGAAPPAMPASHSQSITPPARP